MIRCEVSSFFLQLLFTSFCFRSLILAGNIYRDVENMLSSVIVGETVDRVLSTLIFGLLIGFNLALSTYKPSAFKQALIASAALFYGFSPVYLYKTDYDNTPVHIPAIKPAYMALLAEKH